MTPQLQPELNSTVAAPTRQTFPIKCGTPFIISYVSHQTDCFEAARDIAFVRTRWGRWIDRSEEVVNLHSGVQSSWSSSNLACRILWYTEGFTTEPRIRPVTRGALFVAAKALITKCTRDKAHYRFDGVAVVTPEDKERGFAPNLLEFRLDGARANRILAGQVGNSTLKG